MRTLTECALGQSVEQLVEVKQGSTTLATFAYDGAGRRTGKAASGVTHAYLYDAEDAGSTTSRAA